MDLLKAWPQYPLPHHFLSRIVHALMRSPRLPTLRLAFMRWFVRAYQVAIDEALEPDLAAYPTFNAFFTRALKPGVRPIVEAADAIACPADSCVSQAQRVEGGCVFQAKGRSYTATELLGGDPGRAAPFDGGMSTTLYLSPRDYHRVHMPVDGDLVEMVHVPGRLFSVNPPTTRAIDRLFARNERVVFILDTSAGRLAYVMVGALFVSSVETVWAGEVTPPAGREVRRWTYRTGQHHFRKGQEIARFNMGSTVVLLTEPGRVAWDPVLQPGTPLRMGQRIGSILAGRAGR